MKNDDNTGRFTGFADVYDDVRPRQPEKLTQFIINYLGHAPRRVVDLGCGTGVSTMVWQSVCPDVIGVDASDDMIAAAKAKERPGLRFIKAFGSDTGLEAGSADAVVCSMSFHWMEPVSTLAEIDRILAPGGVFAAVDYDWPPVTAWEAEAAYMKVYNVLRRAEKEDADVSATFTRYDKNRHLDNMRSSGYFRYCREILFSAAEDCTAEKFVNILRSQGSFNTVMALRPELVRREYEEFCDTVRRVYGDSHFPAEYCYRMRIGVK